MKRNTFISSVQIEHYIIRICLPIVIWIDKFDYVVE